MVKVTILGNSKPSSERAIAFAKALFDTKKQMQKEMLAHYENNKEQICEALEKLEKRNERASHSTL